MPASYTKAIQFTGVDVHAIRRIRNDKITLDRKDLSTVTVVYRHAFIAVVRLHSFTTYRSLCIGTFNISSPNLENRGTVVFAPIAHQPRMQLMTMSS